MCFFVCHFIYEWKSFLGSILKDSSVSPNILLPFVFHLLFWSWLLLRFSLSFLFLYFFFNFPTRQLISPNFHLLSFELISHANVYWVSTFSHFEHHCAMSNASRRFFSLVFLFNQHFSLILSAYICLFLSTILNRQDLLKKKKND